MIIKKEVGITPFKQERRLHIYVPDDAFDKQQRYPVMYMFDGHNLFEDEEATYGKSWGLSDGLKPLIDRELPTMPDRLHTAIGGSSMGGLMALYTIFHHNDVFSKAAALSPHIFGMEQVLAETCKQSLALDTRIYVSWGAKECRNKQVLAEYSDYLISIANQHLGQVYLNLKVNGEHNEASWEEELPCFMAYLYEE